MVREKNPTGENVEGIVFEMRFILKQLLFTLALMGSLAGLCSSTQAQKVARHRKSGLLPYAADAIVKNFLAAQRSHEESTRAQGSAIADLNGDGKPEIVLVWTTLGPTYWHNTLTVFSQTSGRYKPVSSLPLNGGARLSSVKDGVIVVNQTMYGKNDPLCCPTVKKQMEYQWSANKLSQLIAMPSSDPRRKWPAPMPGRHSLCMARPSKCTVQPRHSQLDSYMG